METIWHWNRRVRARLVAWSCLSLRPHGLQSTRLLGPWVFFRQEYWSGLPCLPQGDLLNPGIKHRSPSLQTDSLLSEPPGKPKNTRVGSLSLLPGIEPGSPALQANSLPAELPGKPRTEE